MEQLRQRLQALKGQYAEMARTTDGISESFISKFAHGKVTNPTRRKLQVLAEAITEAEEHAR